jgi:predicted nucleotidyltransferase
MDKQDIIKEVVSIIRRYFPRGEFKIMLFGSWARGNAQVTSDIDIGLLGPEAIDDMLLLQIQEDVENIPTLRRIDVVDLNKTDEEFRREVLTYAQRL